MFALAQIRSSSCYSRFILDKGQINVDLFKFVLTEWVLETQGGKTTCYQKNIREGLFYLAQLYYEEASN